MQCSSKLLNCAYGYYTRIFCLYAFVNTRIYTCVYVSLLCMLPSFFMTSIVVQTKDSSGMKKCESSTQILHTMKNVNESLNIFSFQSLHKFTDKLPFINTCLIFSYQKVWRKIETVAWTLYRIKIVFIYQILRTYDFFLWSLWLWTNAWDIELLFC